MGRAVLRNNRSKIKDTYASADEELEGGDFMRSSLTLGERDRRWQRLDEACREAGYDALVFVANDHRGHKGSLRYVADYNLYHRFGYAGFRPGEAPVLHLPAILADVARSAWVEDHRFGHQPVASVAAWLAERPNTSRVGIVGRDEIMRVGDNAFLEKACPNIRFENATPLLDRVRLTKSVEERGGLEEAAAIADRCFAQLLDIVRPGASAREIGGTMLSANAAAGGEDPLFLTMSVENEATGPAFRLSPPRDVRVEADRPFTFSFEMIGPSGYWVEMCRTIVVGRPDPVTQAIGDAWIAAMTAGEAQMRVGGSTDEIHAAAAAALDPERYEMSGWSGHSMGLDVIEWPVIADAAHAPGAALVDGTGLAFHPLILARDGTAMCYMADTFWLDACGPHALSRWPRQIYTVAN